MIYTIQSLRGIFALLIFLSHYKFNSTVILPLGGDFGVSFFFLLSGYIFYRNYEYRTNINYKSFIYSRLQKIYPLHLLLLLFICPLSNHISPKIFLVNALLLQSWLPTQFFLSLNPVSWYLSTLLLPYFLFPFLIKLFTQHGIIVKTSACILCIYAIIMITLPNLHFYSYLSPYDINYWTYIFPPVRILDFILGMLLAKFCNHNSSSIHNYINTHNNVCAILLIAIITTSTILYNHIPQCIQSACWWWIPVSLIITVAIFDTKSFLFKFLNKRILIKFGEISFSFFMLHYFLINLVETIITKYTITIPQMLQLIFTLIITIISAHICEKYIVIKCANKLKSIQNRIRVK